VTCARLGGRQRRIGIEVVVGSQDLHEILVDDHGTVHLAKLEETVGRERDLELEAIVARSEHVLGISDADECAKMTGDDHVEGNSQRSARRGLADCRDEPFLPVGGHLVDGAGVHGRHLQIYGRLARSEPTNLSLERIRRGAPRLANYSSNEASPPVSGVEMAGVQCSFAVGASM